MKLSLDIAFFGSSIVSAYRNGAATYFRGIVRALAARGHRVTFYEPKNVARQKHRDLADPSWADVVTYSNSDPNDAERMLDRARRADVIVKASDVGVFDSLLEKEVPRALKPGATSIFWDVDSTTTLARFRAEEGVEHEETSRSVLSHYDLVFTTAGGPSVVRSYVDLGARLCVPVPPALDPTTHFPVASSQAWFADASLLVNWRADRERRVNDIFFRAASQCSSGTFLLGGSGWDEIDVPSNVRAIGHVYTAEHNGFNAGARCVVAIASDETAELGWSPPARLFEAAGAGACVVTNAWEGVEAFLEPGREVLVVKDGEELAALLRDIDPVRARAFGAAARARALSHHTYAHRAKLIDSILATSSRVHERAEEAAS